LERYPVVISPSLSDELIDVEDAGAKKAKETDALAMPSPLWAVKIWLMPMSLKPALGGMGGIFFPVQLSIHDVPESLCRMVPNMLWLFRVSDRDSQLRDCLFLTASEEGQAMSLG
jgi:hypothetical protein